MARRYRLLRAHIENPYDFDILDTVEGRIVDCLACGYAQATDIVARMNDAADAKGN